MKVYFVGAGPGDPELLTLKADRILRSCRCCVYAGSLVNPEILRRLPQDAERYDSAGMDLPQIIEVMERGRNGGFDVVRLHSGDPSIYGAIREQMNELDRLGIAYEVVPGVSSFQAAAAALPAELTAPEISQTIILTRAAGRTPVPPEQELSELGRTRATLCIFLSVDQLERISAALIPHYGSDCPAAVIYRASWPDQKIIRGTLDDIAGQVRDGGIKKTAQILVGRALSRDLPASKLYDRKFSHGYRRSRGE
jgi:precorrin-4/cobalt-precorrin-4 C11-methyltransferase